MITTYEVLPGTARVWIYQSNQQFDDSETAELQQYVQQFVKEWVSHNQALSAFGDIYFNQFIVLMVDESQAGASGCSIDKSVHFIKAIEQKYLVNMFDRMNFTFKQGDQIKTAPRELFAQLYQKGEIDDHTLVFDNLVKNKEEFESGWLVPLKDSWHKRMV